MQRPNVDVIVPFKGTREELSELSSRLSKLRLAAGDEIIIVDNTPGHSELKPEGDGRATILGGAELQTPGFARNRGASRGRSPWLVFLDADTDPTEGLLDLYFDPSPADNTALLAGGVLDEPVPPDGAPAARFAYLQDASSQRQTFRLEQWAFAQMANAACLRVAFEQINGFREDIRAGEDADLCYRVRLAGWRIERRERACVVHRNRRTISGFIAQKAIHGAAAAWLSRTYPGSFPRRRRLGLMWWAVRRMTVGIVLAVRRRSRDQALVAILDPIEQLAFEFGRTLPNGRPLRLFPFGRKA